MEYGSRMGVVDAMMYGGIGGSPAALVALAADIVASKYHWPWRGNTDGPWPRLVVGVITVVVGTLPAAAAHSEMTGPWPVAELDEVGMVVTLGITGHSAKSAIGRMLARLDTSDFKGRKATRPT